MTDTLLVLNAGSSSLKFTLYAASSDLPCLLRGQIDGLPAAPRLKVRDGAGALITAPALSAPMDQDGAFAVLFDFLSGAGHTERLVGVGHRIVHGGMAHSEPVLLSPDVLAELDALVALAPLHQPANLAAVRRVAHSHPGLAQVGCFDTAFHRSISPLQQRYGLPDALYAAGIRRYGFHGLSYQHIATVLPSYDAAAAAGNTIVLHLGNGCSLSALQQGRSVACSMGFSTLDGVPMATRCGALDPGVLLHLIQQRGLSPAAVEQMLYRESGWLGISGVSADMRVLLASEDAGARTAIDHFVAALVREIGALAAGLGGLDALVFTAGVGENAAPIRAQVLQRLQWLGVEPDSAANAGHGPRITRAGSPIRAWVIPTDEERVIATQTLQVLGSARLS